MNRARAAGKPPAIVLALTLAIARLVEVVEKVAGHGVSASGRAARGLHHVFAGRDAARRRRLRHRNRTALPSLHNLNPRARLAPFRELGLHTVPIQSIRGTAVEGADQRGADFLPPPYLRTADWQARWQRIERAVADLVVLPPVKLVKLGGDYWVLDGHNRVAAALYHDQLSIDAEVVELRLPGFSTTPPADLAGVMDEGRRLRAALDGRRRRTP